MNSQDFIYQIRQGNYIPHSLWILINSETDRDGLALKLISFEGAGEYQRIEVNNEDYLIKSSIFDNNRTYCPKCGIKATRNNILNEKYKCDRCLTDYYSKHDAPLTQLD